MQTPNFSLEEYVSSAVLNSAFAATSGSLALAVQQTFQPGLLNPDTIVTTVSGLSATVTMNQPFGVVFSGGIMAFAHGSQTGQDSQSATVNFTSLVPASGSITAYLVVTSGSIQQGPLGIPGPPAGHPDFNPNFVPTTGYQTNVDTLLLSATATPPNNSTTFELARTTLAFGATGLALTASSQNRATPSDAMALFAVTGSYAITPQASPYAVYPSTTGLTTTLPPVANSCGLPFRLVNAQTSSWTIAAAGTDLIYGPVASGAVTSFVLPGTQTITLFSDGYAWFTTAATPVGFTPVQQGGGTGQGTNKVYIGYSVVDGYGFPRIQVDSTDFGGLRRMSDFNMTANGTPGNSTFTVPGNVTILRIQVVGGGGGGGGGGSGADLSGGGGGGAGGFGEEIVAVTPGQVISYTVGAGGFGGTPGSDGGSGGNTVVYVGSNLVGYGGTFGDRFGNGGLGGSSTGTIPSPGGDGDDGTPTSASANVYKGGAGGASYFGGGGRGAAPTISARYYGGAGQAYGSGGGGGIDLVGGGGGAGQVGLVVFYW